ncbi:MAG: ATP-binding protein [Deltaproteobacteria bacterium]|nr:ATP-binding protein [Deltaproteobacteria bacterium]
MVENPDIIRRHYYVYQPGFYDLPLAGMEVDMDKKLPLLPLGMSEFKEIRDMKIAYVDKTNFLPELRKCGKVVFFARPRRFGKSLALSTLDSFYSGDITLFNGLSAEKIMTSPDFVPRPVIRLIMSRPSGAVSQEQLKKNIVDELTKSADRHGVSLRGDDPAAAFVNLIPDVKKARSQDVVLLIDEYDAPVIKVIQTPGLAKIKDLLEDTRTIMSNFYSKIKDAEADLHFVLITGVTKFSRMGIFSSLNTIKDISLSPQFASLVGFTHEELIENFKPFIEMAARKFNLNETELLEKVRDYYDGFSFDGETRLYNPQSMLNFFQDLGFYNFWMKSGSNTLIREMMRDKGLTAEQFKGLKVSRDFVDDPGEIEQTPPHGFLYQAGYLSLRVNPQSDSSFLLDYPNFEVRSSFSKLFIENVIDSISEADSASIELEKHISEGNVEAVVNCFTLLFAKVCYDDHTVAYRFNFYQSILINEKADETRLINEAIGLSGARRLTERLAAAIKNKDFEVADRILTDITQKTTRDKKLKLKLDESFYRSLLMAFLLGANIKVYSELHTNLGRSDLTIEYKGKCYVIELKMVEETKEAQNAAKIALNQIIEKNYAGSHSNPIIIGLAVSEDIRNIAASFYAKDNKINELQILEPFNDTLGTDEKDKRKRHLKKTKLEALT